MARGRTGSTRPSSRAAREIVRNLSDDMVRKLASIRGLWLAVQNEPDKSVKDMSVEFYYAVGELLEGKPLEQIELFKIDPKRVTPFIKEG